MVQITSSGMMTRRSQVVPPDVSARATRRRPWSHLAAIATLVLAAILGLSPRDVLAQVTWTGTTADGNWATTGAFAGGAGALTLANNFNQQLVFAGASQLSSTNTLTGGTAGSINFRSDGFVLSGNTIRLGGNITNNTTSGTNTIGLNMNLNNATRTISGSAGSRLVLSGNLSNGSLTVNRAGSGTPLPTFVLSGSNTITGTTNVSNAVLTLANTNALGSSVLRPRLGNFDVIGGPLSFTNNLELDAAGNAIVFVGSSEASFTGTTTVISTNGSLNVNAASLTLRTIASSSAGIGISKTGTSMLIITDAAQPIAPNLTLNGGILEIRNAAALGTGTLTLTSGTFQTNANMTVSAPVVGGAAVLGGVNNFTLSGVISGGALNKFGNNTVTLSGSNSYTGVTTVNSGVLLLDSANALPGGIGSSGGTSNLQLGASGGQNDGVVGLKSGTFARSVGGTANQVNMQFGGGFAAYGPGVAVNIGGTTGSLQWGQTSFLNGAGAILVLGADGATDAIDFQNPINFNFATARTIKVDNGSSIVDAIMSGAISNSQAGGLTKTGLGTLALTAASTYTGTTTVSAGTLQIGNSGSTGSISNSSPVSVSSGASLAFFRSDDVIYSGTVSGAGGLTKLGASKLTLTTAHTYTGTTSISTGTLQIGNGGATGSIQNSSPVSVASGAALAFNRSDALTYSGTVSGAGGLAKLGASTLTLDTAQAYTGATTITTGTLRIGNNGTTGSIQSSSPVSVASGAALAFYRSDDLTFSNAVSGAGGLVKQGGSTLTLDTTQAYTGATSVSEGALVVNGSIVASSGVGVVSGATLGGSGAVSAITGAGLVSPGNSPGILTATSADLSSGLDFAFEFTQAGEPTWSSATASGNDLLRLTNLTTPIVGTAGAGNVFNIYFATDGQTYRGGLFTDRTSSFETLIANATFNYFVQSATGTVTFNGTSYNTLAPADVTRSTVQVASADFSGGTVSNGYTMEFVVVPEPQTIVLFGIGSAVIGWSLLNRRRRSA